MRIKRIPAGFIVPAQPILMSKPPSGPDWVHEIKHHGYRLIVGRDFLKGVRFGSYDDPECEPATFQARNILHRGSG
jgi:hypothetical protein